MDTIKCGALDDERQTWSTSSTSVDSAKYKQQNGKVGIMLVY